MSRPSFEDFLSGRASICVLGLGYVGLPLAAVLARKFRVVGFDINVERVAELRQGLDRTRELTKEQLLAAKGRKPETGRRFGADGEANLKPEFSQSSPFKSQLSDVSFPGLTFSTDPKVLSDARIIIVTVPTPIDDHKKPDLTPLIKSSTAIGRHIQRGTTVVYESTVYPGCTEEDCLPIIAKESGLKWKQDFFAGYSPERINPGDKEHTVDKIKKVVAGDTAETAEMLKQIYGAVITAGIFVAATIKTAEAAKVIENTQRDLNIALMNELALIFDRMGINTIDVLEAAGTKWNFLPFRPGLVGGHCIGVDPYYLTHKAESLGYHPQVILAGRRINDGMGKFIAEKTVKLLIAHDRPVKKAKVLILGWTFKEDVPDIRNTRVVDIYRELLSYGVDVRCYDPQADRSEVRHEYGLELLEEPPQCGPFDAVILAVKHHSLLAAFPWEKICVLGGDRPPIIVDVKGFIQRSCIKAADVAYFQL